MQRIKINSFFNQVPGVIFLLGVLSAACTSDQLPEPIVADCSTLTPTYTEHIRPIIEQSCAFSGCHLDSAPGVYDSYAGLLPSLQNNRFLQRVIIERSDELKGMPPNFTPDDRPQDLTEEQIQLIDCWLQAGFPE